MTATRLEHDLLFHMFKGDLKTAESMARIGDLGMARRELKSALQKLDQIEKLSPPPAPPEPPTLEV